MLDRQACQRRVYRLATLLIGDPVAAAAIIGEVVSARGDLRTMDGAHMDRLTILRCRERAAVMLADPHLPDAAGRVVAELTPQQREAWILVRVYQTPVRDAARAMDCSVGATQRHLHSAEALMAAAGGDGEVAGEAILRYSLGLDVPAFYRKAEQRRAAWKRAVIMAVILGIAAAAAAGAILLRG